MDDDRDQPDRRTNTLILNQIGQPPPPSVLGAVLAATAGTTPVHVAALPEWGDGESTWRVLGCTDRVLFEVKAHKNADDWYGPTERGGELEEVSCSVVPFSRLAGATFELSDMVGGGFGEGRARAVGTWHLTPEAGETITVPGRARSENTRAALAGIVETVLAALG